MGISYGSYCPVAKAMELLDERWTMLIVRELADGGLHFNDLRRGMPKISPTLLSARLQRLARAGIVSRREHSNRVVYELTPAGLELRPIVDALGTWGIRWVPELGDADLDPKLLLWDMHRNVDPERIPDGRTVVCFTFPGVSPRVRDWWLVIQATQVDVCDVDPGHPVEVAVTADLRSLINVWRGDLPWSQAIRAGDLRITGPEHMRRALPGWFRPQTIAAVPRPQPERRALLV